jgi:SAM-dependent methyltransferase
MIDSTTQSIRENYDRLDAGTIVFGLDISQRMIEQARQLNPDISFQEGNMLALDLPSAMLGGIAAFYAIVNIPKESLPLVFREMERVLQPGGLLLLAFHMGDETLHPNELWGQTVSMDFFLFPPPTIRHYEEAAGLAIEEVLEREPYPPDVEYQNRRAYILARKPGRLSSTIDTHNIIPGLSANEKLATRRKSGSFLSSKSRSVLYPKNCKQE